MIFVTVGTHEQQFNRVIEEVDRLKGEGIIEDDVFIQTGFSTYEPKYCKWDNLITFKEMDEMIKSARIIITHGGPATFIAPLRMGKIPVVIPRQIQYGEHVNNHQVEFVKELSDRKGSIIPIYNIRDLEKTLVNYDKILMTLNKNNESNNEVFCEKFEKIVQQIMKQEGDFND